MYVDQDFRLHVFNTEDKMKLLHELYSCSKECITKDMKTIAYELNHSEWRGVKKKGLIASYWLQNILQ